ncbi:MAG: methionyl-tRNA formyltransferase [Cyanobacteria bacterium RYN_339]|nr:methionyl-tRNA formyltransferase [Cyanobacteria bacterium RYN_339]
MTLTRPLPDGPVLFMGTPAFAVPTLQAMLDAGWPIAGVVCQPDKPAGRGQKLTPPPVKELALAKGLPVFQPDRVRKNPEFIEQLRALDLALIVVVAYGKILPQELLDLPRHGCLNLHGSLLPKYRGAAPIQWAIIRGETVTGVTLMRMDVGMDTGDMLATAELPIGPDDTTATLFPKLAEVGAKLAIERIPDWVAGTLPPIPQAHDQHTMAPMLAKDTGRLDWTRPAKELGDLIRGVTPWPGATTELLGQPLKIAAARPEAGGGASPGTLLGLDADGWRVATGDGVLLLTMVQTPGKPARAAADVARGWRELAAGVRLGESVGAAGGT